MGAGRHDRLTVVASIAQWVEGARPRTLPNALAPVIAAAQAEAQAQGIAGKAVTPFLLQQIFERTEGRSLTANIALVRNNARLGAQIAQALNNIRTSAPARPSGPL